MPLTLVRPSRAQPAPLRPRVLSAIAAPPVLELRPDDIEAGLIAIGEREDVVGPDERARLRRVRMALEAALAHELRR